MNEKRKPGRPKLGNRVQVTVKINKVTRDRLIANAEMQGRRTEIGKVIDKLVEKYL